MTTVAEEYCLLTSYGNIGFYQSCEVTQFFLIDKHKNKFINLYILVTFEEEPFKKTNLKYLTNKPIKFDDNYSVSIQRYHLSLDETAENFLNILNHQKWNFQNNTSLILDALKPLRKQFIPAFEDQRTNIGLKNNFHNGCYILEFFSESKENVQPILALNNLDKLNKLAQKIKQVIQIDLSIFRDRIGNIIFQFPIGLLEVKSGSLKTNNGIALSFAWHRLIRDIPKCYVQVEAIIDRTNLASIIVDYNGDDHQIIDSGNSDQINHINIYRRSPSLLLHKFVGSYLKEFNLNIGITGPQKRHFEARGECFSVEVTTFNASNSSKMNDYTTWISNIVYEKEKEQLEQSLSFKQYFDGRRKEAIKDIRTLIKRFGRTAIYLWDPFLTSTDILDTLFHCEIANLPLRAIGAIGKSQKKLRKGENPNGGVDTHVEYIARNRIALENCNSNYYGLNLEFRLQYWPYGWTFHDRFLLFPGSVNTRPRAYSLGTSVNSLGNTHHILQEVSHPQRIIDSYEELWKQLSKKECLVWKSNTRI